MYSPNDNLQIALIGCGGMGQGDARLATSIQGVKLIAASDCYDGRLQHMKEVYGPDTFTTRNYQDIVGHKDIDAVIIGTPDHWHARISIDCMNSGKHVYCEKPMVHAVEEGHSVINAQQQSGKVFQVGSQYRSSLMYQKANELYKSGAIGKLNMVEAWLDRNTAMGAWEYTIPPNANTTTCDWTQFQGNAPKRAWDPKRFFRWRNYRDYGTGVAGDLFVHLITGLHTVTESIGPNRIYATGGLRYWKDGRDVPDVMLATMDYPETDAHPAFNFVLRVNFKSGVSEAFGVKFIGSDGTMSVSFSDLDLQQVPRPDEFDYTIASFTNDMQKRLREAWNEKHPADSVSNIKPNRSQKFSSEINPQLIHHQNFYRSIREGAPMIEDATFGLRAAGPALLTNQSLFESKVMSWDPQNMTVG
ncbi:MAG TPA: Gfo/Idh/MocA family oxidoreductase [Bryobacteraceae bacterium]|nr:Gfo/Idh/MocA family oxidoreductase [Bryobacteraceae bacterium]